MRKPTCLWMLLLLAGMPVFGQELYRGDVNVRTEAERIVVTADVNRDGVSDHEFTLHTSGAPAQLVTYGLADAQVLFMDAGIYVTSLNDPTTIALTLDGAKGLMSSNDTVRITGFGVSHATRSAHVGNRPLNEIRANFQQDPGDGTGGAGGCASGGPGSSSCSITLREGRSCSVSCGAGYYACCTSTGTCTCKRG